VKPEDVDGWIDRVTGLAASPSLCAQLTGSALRLVETRYDWDRLGEKLRNTFENWLMNHSSMAR
jgi:glycosyltransferase involved in cell wall biosynthesis